MLWCKREVEIFLHTFLNLKSKNIIKCAVPQIERKRGKFTGESNLSEDPNITKTKIKANELNRIFYWTQFKICSNIETFKNKKQELSQTFPVINSTDLAVRVWSNHKTL